MRFKQFVYGLSARVHCETSTLFRTFLTLAGVVIFCMGASHESAAQVPETAIPPAGTKLAKDLQKALDTSKCFPPGTPNFARVDGKFGLPNTNTKSRQAITNWISTTGLNASGFLTPQQLLKSVTTTAATCSTKTKNVCRKDLIGKQYLAGLKGVDDVQRLAKGLRTAISNFDKGETDKQSAIFPPGKGTSIEISDADSLNNIKDHGTISVTPATTKKALKDALHNFDNLVLSYALKAPECLNCGLINDWLYLRNIASANAGILIAKSPTTEAFKAFNVSLITKGQLEKVRDNIYVFRVITTKLNQTLTDEGESKDIGQLIVQRNSHLYAMLDFFKKTKETLKGTTMELLHSEGKCNGFTGSAIYH